MSPRYKAGYTTASSRPVVVDRNPLQGGGGPYTRRFCSRRCADEAGDREIETGQPSPWSDF